MSKTMPKPETPVDIPHRLTAQQVRAKLSLLNPESRKELGDMLQGLGLFIRFDDIDRFIVTGEQEALKGGFLGEPYQMLRAWCEGHVVYDMSHQKWVYKPKANEKPAVMVHGAPIEVPSVKYAVGQGSIGAGPVNEDVLRKSAARISDHCSDMQMKRKKRADGKMALLAKREREVGPMRGWHND
mgnify:CR=1 FL=1